MCPVALLPEEPFRPCKFLCSSNSTFPRSRNFSTINFSFNIRVNPDILRQIAWYNFHIYGTYQWIILSLIARGPKLNTWLRRVAFRDILPDHPENVRAMIRAYL